MQVLESKINIEQQFYDSVFVISHSIKTVSTYKTGINHLKTFLQSEYEFDEIRLADKINQNEIDVFEFLRLVIIYLDKKGIRPRGMRSYLSGIKGYLRFLGIKINSDDYKLLVKIPKIVRTREIPITKEMILRILRIASPKLQTSILVTLASGIRLGELVQLKLSDIDFNSNPTRITIRGNTSKGRISRETFLTSEATNALKDYLKKYFDWKEGEKDEYLQDTYIFWKISKSKKLSILPKFDTENAKQTLQISLRHHIKKIPDLTVKNENGLMAVHFHAFRKFFRTEVGNACGRDYAEALMGHSFYMDTYYQLPEEKKCQMYLEAEPHLTISDTKLIENNFKSISQKYESLEHKFEDLFQYLRTNSIQVPDFLNDHRSL